MVYPGGIATNIDGPTDNLLEGWKFRNSYHYNIPDRPFGPVATAADRVLTSLKDNPFAVFYTRDGLKTIPVLYFVAQGNTHGKRYGIERGQNRERPEMIRYPNPMATLTQR